MLERELKEDLLKEMRIHFPNEKEKRENKYESLYSIITYSLLHPYFLKKCNSEKKFLKDSVMSADTMWKPRLVTYRLHLILQRINLNTF